MKKTPLMRKVIGAIALIMTIATVLSACEINLTPPATTTPTPATTPADTPTTSTTPEGSTPAPGPDAPIDPPSHVCVFGDWEIVKEATNTEDGLRERKCECGKVEQEIIEASNTEFYIQYRNLKSAAYPSETGYNSKDGLLNLPQPEAVGYTFVGWYTASIGGELVDYIPEGSQKNYILFAHWELISYTITYKNVPNNTNVTSYNIEDKVKLETPKWVDMVFTHWSDANGNTYIPDINITSMPEKMTGDLTLTANWKTLENIATPASTNAQLYTVFCGDDGFLHFYYDLGTIEHVVLDDVAPKLYYKAEGMQIDLTLSQTKTIGEEKAESISNTISQSISQTSAWESTYSKAATLGSHWNAEIGGGIQAGIGGGSQSGVNGEINGSVSNDNASIGEKLGKSLSKLFNFSVSAHIEGTYNWGKGESTTEQWGSSQSYSSTQTDEQSQTITSALVYKQEVSSEINETFSIGAALPSGYYAYVHASNIRVIAVVSYEISTGYLYLNTYSGLDNMHSMMLYYADVNQLNNPTVEGLDFTIPEEEIINMVENSYYVKYDANGGTGTMNPTMHSINGSEKLAANAFTKQGSLFAGWELTTESGVKILLDGQSVTNLGKAHETVVLKALWEKDPHADIDVVHPATTKSGTLSSSPKITYSANIEYRNRTADSVQIRVVWKSTIAKGSYTVYGQNFKFSVGSVNSGTVKVAGFNTWKNATSSDRTCTGESGWITVSLNTTSATSLDVKIYYWQTNSNNVDMNKYDGTSCVNTTWTINIPAY